MPDTSRDPQKPVKAPQKPDDERFNPLRNEADMFRIVLWVTAVSLALIVAVFLLRAIF